MTNAQENCNSFGEEKRNAMYVQLQCIQSLWPQSHTYAHIRSHQTNGDKNDMYDATRTENSNLLVRT